MSSFKEWQLQFDQVYDGGYRYLDRCGLFMTAVRQEHGFMPTAVNPAGCDMEQPVSGLRLQASVDTLAIICSNPSKVDLFLRASDFASKKAVEIFEPFAVHQIRVTSRSLWETKAAKESHKLSVELLKHSTAYLSQVLQMTATQQDTTFIFEAGTRQISLRIHPVVRNVSGERKMPMVSMPKAYAKFIEEKEKNLSSNVPSPAQGLALEMSVIEVEPPVERSAREMNDLLTDYRKLLLKQLDR